MYLDSVSPLKKKEPEDKSKDKAKGTHLSEAKKYIFDVELASCCGMSCIF